MSKGAIIRSLATQEDNQLLLSASSVVRKCHAYLPSILRNPASETSEIGVAL